MVGQNQKHKQKHKQKYKPVNKKLPEFWHGADYNPDQWLHRPDILTEDLELMGKANCNVMAVGIFAWAALEPAEGEYNFDWLDERMDRLAENGIYTILATPSGARPAWMSKKYPQVLRVKPSRKRILHGNRHNHCFSSPVYRKKVAQINRKLAERYKNHPGLLLWHISNEYSGACHCDLCQQEFRNWLKEKYGSLDNLNKSWWTAFWSHTYTDWQQIESPAPHGEKSIQALTIDWKRFTTAQTIDFYRNEIKPLREITPNVPVTTNFMGSFPGLDYWKFAAEVDVVSWDNYPRWHNNWEEDREVASGTAFVHDLQRSLKKGQPFLMMESTPDRQNWRQVAKQKKPGMHQLSSLQAVAHGSDSVQYFQWRMGRGGCEKFHGAVVDQAGDVDRRTFQEVKETGTVLEQISKITGSTVVAKTALMFDWQNRWALEEALVPRNEKDYEQICKRHYQEFWKRGLAVDIVSEECSFSDYKLLIIPMLYSLRGQIAEKLRQFVEEGGTIVLTYFSGLVDENDLCFQQKGPGPLQELAGLSVAEITPLYEKENYQIAACSENELELEGCYRAQDFCEKINLQSAEKLAVYKTDYYQETPAVTVNNLGRGQVYYLASRNNQEFLVDFYGSLIERLDLQPALQVDLPEGISIQKRTDGKENYLFVMNFSQQEKEVKLPADKKLFDMIAQKEISQQIKLDGYGFKVCRELSS